MKTPFAALLLAAPLVAGATMDAAAQQAQAYAVRPCGRLGISFSPGDGLVVEDVMRNSPAERAGVQPSDTLVALDGAPVTRETLPERATRIAPGETVELRVRRAGEARDIEVVAEPDVCVVRARALDGPSARRSGVGPDVLWIPPERQAVADSLFAQLRRRQAELDVVMRRMRLAEQQRLDSLRRALVEARNRRGPMLLDFPRSGRPGTDPGQRPQRVTVRSAGPVGDAVTITAYRLGERAIAGVEFTQMNPGLASYFQSAADGLLVLQVAPGTPGARTGLHPGDVVVRADGNEVRTIGELRMAIARAGDVSVRLTVVRRGEERELVFQHDD